MREGKKRKLNTPTRLLAPLRTRAVCPSAVFPTVRTQERDQRESLFLFLLTFPVVSLIFIRIDKRREVGRILIFILRPPIARLFYMWASLVRETWRVISCGKWNNRKRVRELERARRVRGIKNKPSRDFLSRLRQVTRDLV